MYPGCSPKDIEYGKAAMEAGEAFARARAAGVKTERDTMAPDYKLRQQHGLKRQKFNISRESNGNNGKVKDKSTANGQNPPKPAAVDANGNASGMNEEGQYFVVDTNPTPVSLPIG